MNLNDLFDVYRRCSYDANAETLLALVNADNINQSFLPISTMTPLKLMIKIGTAAQVEQLLGMGADPNQIAADSGLSIVGWAIIHGSRFNSDIVRVLLDHCVVPIINTPLLTHTMVYSSWDNVWLIIDRGGGVVPHARDRLYSSQNKEIDETIAYREACRESVRTALCVGQLARNRDVWGLIARHAWSLRLLFVSERLMK